MSQQKLHQIIVLMHSFGAKTSLLKPKESQQYLTALIDFVAFPSHCVNIRSISTYLLFSLLAEQP